MGETTQEEGWVVCRLFKKKNHHKTLDNPISTSRTTEARTQNYDSFSGGALKPILQHMGNTGKEENEAKHSPIVHLLVDTCTKNGFHEEFMKLPSLESSNSTVSQNYYHPINPAIITANEGLVTNQVSFSHGPNSGYQTDSAALTNWAALDRLIASQLNDPTVTYFPDHDLQLPTLRSSSSSNRSCHLTQDYSTEIDLWSYAQPSSSFLSSDPKFHVPNVAI
ncbi:NAC domain-containing protein 43 [Morella rubra]|uniref:NAC domain-containing protein 43 n=1 Tax=Morella rubra TaxID=262757 RepID=A0A6A1VJY8_9ROSI|nr:NAC domain-containing protein 43 [Morella rubra]